MSTLCGAKNRQGEPCRQLIPDGFTRCHWHGGAAPQSKAAAARRNAEKRATKILADLGSTTPVTDPIGELERIAGQAVALTNLLRGAVSELEEIRYKGGLGEGTENVRGELQAYMTAMARAESILTRLASLGLDERRVRVQEAQAIALAAALAAVLAHHTLGLDDERQRIARGLLETELRGRELLA